MVKTDDLWSLTLFHITGYIDDPEMEQKRAALTDGKLPVLTISGSFGDAQRWLNDAKGGKPMHLQLFDNGYDLWMGNNRGTKYSNVSELFPEQNEDFERWNFSWAELGMYDVPAFMDQIIEVTG